MDVFPALDCSSSVINHQEEEDDDEWVVVKKQKIIILIPPPSPPSQQNVKETSPKSAKQSKSVKHSSFVTKEKTSGHRRKTCNMLHVDGSGQVDPKPKLQQPQSSFHAYYGIGHVGAVKVVDRKIRAMNLESKLRSLGGMRKWLSLLGLDRFAQVLEMKNVSQHQLVNLSTSKLKGMGMNAVGPRRKLIHAIDLLSQPYYSQRRFHLPSHRETQMLKKPFQIYTFLTPAFSTCH
ncbi:uncharacterized protein LOC110102679 isoform X2 [Dendrobium catenatum]|nr:uncharacterized protein LOC110102679 isoform X2 [Dendrobium catenatum]XP_020686775.1 uncharacterized protein LOC110102679 isoform X2 [Dendrobium catenatum]XP_020686776.1 uncharacterized protein LOC110102679 isoform X2 [Dendrobium catenatum]XP_028554342.1 uncharacterized protein LOC110102679 isoform X2 [Dendrobium catenatum]